MILGVDPGKFTGVAVWWSRDHFANTEVEMVDTAVVEAPDDVVTVVRKMTLNEQPTLIACERFVVAPGAKLSSQPDASRICTEVRSFAQAVGRRVVWQSPGPAKKIAPVSLLNKLHYRRRGQTDHEDNATQHIMLCLATYFPDAFAKIIGI